MALPARIVLASGNAGKLREFRTLLVPWDTQLLPQSAFKVSSIAETGGSYLENAMLKARHAAQRTGLPTLADDSGLEVDALDGRPGFHSARFAGENASDADNNQRLLTLLQGVPKEKRSARYRCVVVLVLPGGEKAPLVGEGCWEGHILEVPQGAGGFGYDPLFLAAERNSTAAQLPAADKNELGHRGKALRALLQLT